MRTSGDVQRRRLALYIFAEELGQSESEMPCRFAILEAAAIGDYEVIALRLIERIEQMDRTTAA